MDASVAFFDSFAPEYDSWAGGLHDRLAKRLVEWVDPLAAEVVLDVGCGTGLVANRSAELVGPWGSVLGLDVSVEMLKRAQGSALPNTSYHLIDVDSGLPFQTGTFDLVTFGDALDYLRDPFTALERARRLLHRGGRVGLSLRRRSLITEAQSVFFNLLDELADVHPLVIPEPERFRYELGEPDVISEMLQDAGFRELRITEMVTGMRTRSATAWIDLMKGAGPLPHALLSTLGPFRRRQLEEALACEMQRLRDDAFLYHEGFVFVSGVSR